MEVIHFHYIGSLLAKGAMFNNYYNNYFFMAFYKTMPPNRIESNGLFLL